MAPVLRKPKKLVCDSFTATPKSLSVGKRSTIVVRVTAGGKWRGQEVVSRAPASRRAPRRTPGCRADRRQAAQGGDRYDHRAAEARLRRETNRCGRCLPASCHGLASDSYSHCCALGPRAGSAGGGMDARERRRGGRLRPPQLDRHRSSAPRNSARRVTVLKEFRSEYRPQVVLVLSQRVDPETGKPTWYRISVPGRPTAIRAGSGRRSEHPPLTTADLHRPQRPHAQVWNNRRLLLKTKVAVGRPGMETPVGLFYVTWTFLPTAPVLGKYAFETSAYSRLSDWPGGGIVGIHERFPRRSWGRPFPTAVCAQQPRHPSHAGARATRNADPHRRVESATACSCRSRRHRPHET